MVQLAAKFHCSASRWRSHTSQVGFQLPSSDRMPSKRLMIWEWWVLVHALGRRSILPQRPLDEPIDLGHDGAVNSEHGATSSAGGISLSETVANGTRSEVDVVWALWSDMIIICSRSTVNRLFLEQREQRTGRPANEKGARKEELQLIITTT
jgi:hypothetical protein